MDKKGLKNYHLGDLGNPSLFHDPVKISDFSNLGFTLESLSGIFVYDSSCEEHEKRITVNSIKKYFMT